MKKFEEFNNINEAHFSNQERDLGYGIKTNMLNILRNRQYISRETLKSFLGLYGIPIHPKTIHTKKDLNKVISELTLKDIEKGYILLYNRDVLPLSQKDFKDELTFNNVNILSISDDWRNHSGDIILNRKKISLKDAKQVIRAHKVKTIKDIIKDVKTAPQKKELDEVFKEFGINFRYIDNRLNDNMEKLAQEIINLRNKKDD